MIVRTSTRSVHAWRRIRFALLVLAALFVVHDAVYLVHFGPGEGMATAMANHGHHAYWEPFTYLAVLAAGVLAFAAIAHFVLLELRLNAEGNDRKPVQPRTSAPYVLELRGLWFRLFPLVGLAFLSQENVEAAAAGSELPGLTALAGHDYPFALPVIALVTFLIAAIGAVVRWRIAALEMQVAAARLSRPQFRIFDAPLPVGWWIAAAVCAHRWILARTDPGRAPPRPLAV